MAHKTVEKSISTVPMLPKDNGVEKAALSVENGEDKVVIMTPNTTGKILLREDTIIANINGCVCGRGQFMCAGVKKQWTSLCWGRYSDQKYYTLLLLLAATFVLSLIGSVFFCFTNTINDAILSNMIIRNNSLAYSVWRRPNVQPLMRVRIFNYTNWQEVRNGDERKLRVEEMGPYVYSQQLERVRIKFDGDQLSFQERNQFEYLPNKTVGAHFDQVTVPNLPLLGVISKAKNMNLNFVAQMALNQGLQLLNHPNAFVKLPVHRFLWGYDDDIITYAQRLPSFQGGPRFKYDQFGLLISKNGTVSERFTINTGEVDMDKMNLIEKVDGQSHLPYWNDRECNRIDGSDGSIFPPSMLDKKQTLYVFYPNLCRRLPFVYEKEIEINDGIILYRYRMPRNVFDDPSRNRANQCYCEMDSGTCPPRGVINVTACTMGAPAMVSFPHFYLGDEKLREDIIGMRPDASLHESHIDIHPTLGIALQGRSSLQINIQVRKSDFFTSVRYLNEGLILPVAWVEMEVEELPEGLKTLVYHGTYSTAAAQLGLTVLSVLALAVSSVCLMLLLVQRRRKPCVVMKMSDYITTEERRSVTNSPTGSRTAPEGLKTLVYHGTYSTAAAQLGLAGLSVLALAASSVGLALLLLTRRRRPCAVMKMVPGENLANDSNS